MKSLTEGVFAQLPAYLPDLIAVVSRPKQTIAARSGGDSEDLPRAVVFVGITVGLGFLLQAPAIGPHGDFLVLAASMAVFKVVAILLFRRRDLGARSGWLEGAGNTWPRWSATSTW